MQEDSRHTKSVIPAIERVMRELVSAHHFPDASFVSLPLSYPGGGAVTVKIDRAEKGYRVSDSGFAFREVEAIGAELSFARTAGKIVEQQGLIRESGVVFVDVPEDQLYRGICDVGAASWHIADKIFSKVSEQEQSDLEEFLRVRLSRIFGEGKVQIADPQVVGSSTSSWTVSAVVYTGNRPTAFQAVGTHGNSVYRASSEFHDIASLDTPPNLVAVVRSKAEMGTKLGLISSVAKVIEENQPDEIYQKAAAA